MSTFPQCFTIFELTRKQKRNQLFTDQNNGSNDKNNQLTSLFAGQRENFIMGLTKNGKIYIWGEFVFGIPNEDGTISSLQQSSGQHDGFSSRNNRNEFLYNKLIQLTPLQINSEGTLYAWGDDTEQKYGLLGLGQQYKAIRPCPNSYLFDYMIKSISISDQHACAVDSSGRLFCWGFGPNGELGLDQQVQQISVPTISTKQKQINVKKAICHTNYTAFCSVAGYVYLFGTLLNQTGERMRQSQTRAAIGSQITNYNSANANTGAATQRNNAMHKSNSQLVFENNINVNRGTNVCMKSVNRPFNVGGDTFIIALTSTGDVFFVDDSLESVQISSAPIDSIAIAGCKILGLSKQQTFYEWNTGGMNRLSFNKENKLLMRQDFQVKKFKLKEEFSQNAVLSNFQMSKNNVALIFEDIAQLSSQQLEQNEDNIVSNNQKFLVAELVKQCVRSPTRNNPLNLVSDSSINSPSVIIKEENIMKRSSSAKIQQEQIQPKQSLSPLIHISPSQFLNTSRFGKRDSSLKKKSTNKKIVVQDDSFVIAQNENQREENDQKQDQQINIFNNQSSPDKQQEVKKSHFQISKQPFQGLQFYQQQEEEKQYPSQNPQTQFFFDNTQNINNGAFQYRPSSIKSYKQSYNKSASSYFNNTSNQSLKQCHADMQPLERNSKIEISFPSFLNLSNEIQNAKMQRQSSNISSSNNNNQQNQLGMNGEGGSVVSISPIIHRNSAQNQFTQQNMFQNQKNQQQQRYDFQIKVQTVDNNHNNDDDILSQHSSFSSKSRGEASIKSKLRETEDFKEESITVTIDNYKIKTTKTTTPKRLLNNYTMNKRQQINNTLTPSQNNPILNPQSNSKSQLSVSQQSVLSNGFNLTSQSIHGITKDNINKKKNIQQQDQSTVNIYKENSLTSLQKYMQQQQQPQNNSKSNNKSSNSKKNSNKKKQLSHSCGAQSKRASFIKAILAQSKAKQNFEIVQDPTSVTQIYSAPPLKNKQKSRLNQTFQEHISEEDVNLVMSSSEGGQKQQEYDDSMNKTQKSKTMLLFNNTQNQQEFQVEQCDEDYQNNQYEQDQNYIPRETIGITQTEENIEVEYSISNSCTPQSMKSESRIKRKINFDDASGGTQNLNTSSNQGIIRFSDQTNNNNKCITSFRLTINQNNSKQQNEQMLMKTNKSVKESNLSNSMMPTTSFKDFNNQKKFDEQSQSFIFNQYQSPPPVQPFIEENVQNVQNISNIKSNSTPGGMQESNTHIMMMTEEKFKNLKSEISQNDQQNQFLITQSNLLSSPQLNDFKLTKVDSRSLLFMNQSNLQNLSCFIKQNKYLQVYENFRRAFMNLCKLQDQRKMFAIRKIKKFNQDKKQKNEFLTGMAKFLFNTLKNHIMQNQQIGFKRIKKFYKEKQLQVYIRKKQNEFAMKSQVLIKVDQIITQYNTEIVRNVFTNMIQNYYQIKKINQEKRKQSIQTLQSLLLRKMKNFSEKSFRNIQNLANEKKIVEMQVKMLNRVAQKIVLKKLKSYFNQILESSHKLQQQKKAFQFIFTQILKSQFNYFKLQAQRKTKIMISIQLLQQIKDEQNMKQQKKYRFKMWKQIVQRFYAIKKISQFYNKHSLESKLKPSFQIFYEFSQQQQQKQKQKNVQKALIFILFQKLQELVKAKLKESFSEIQLFQQQQETMMVAKSMTSGNLSFSLNSLANDPSLILTRNQKNNQAYFSNEQQQIQPKKNLNIKQKPGTGSKTLQKSQTQNQQHKRFIIKNSGNNDNKKPKLNDYLSFSPQTFIQFEQNQQQIQQQQQPQSQSSQQNQFQIRRKTEACNSSRTQNSNRYFECPLPQKQNQQQYIQTASSNENQAQQTQKRSRNNANNALKQSCTSNAQSNKQSLNVSIKDMNAAFRNEVSRIKEKQEDSCGEMYSSSQQNSSCNFGDSLDCNQKEMLLDIELSQTPDILLQHKNNQNDNSYYCNDYYASLKQKTEDVNKNNNEKKNRRSPQINPLCTSESYYNGTTANNNLQLQLSNMQHKQGFQHQYISNDGDGGVRYSSQQVSQNTSAIEETRIKVPMSLKNLQDPLQNLQSHAQDSLPKTSTFGCIQIKNDIEQEIQQQMENIQQDEDKENYSNNESMESNTFQNNNHNNKMKAEQQQPLTFRENSSNQQQLQQQSTQRKKSDSRYQRMSYLEQDFSMDYDTSHNMFEEFNVEEKEKQIIRLQCAQNTGMSMVKTSLADLSRKLELTTILAAQGDCSQDVILQNFIQVSPKFTESCIPSQYKQFYQYQRQYQEQQQQPFNREMLNEMAANYQMLELTPDADLHMLLNNKSIYQGEREESMYSTSQYADPVEMTLSPRLISNNANPNKNTVQNQFQTIQTQVNYYQTSSIDNQSYLNYPNNNNNNQNQLTEEISGSEDVDEEDSCQINEEYNESRPYDFELSTNSKYKVVSEDQNINQILKSETTFPTNRGVGIKTCNVNSYNNTLKLNNNEQDICKKLSFGNIHQHHPDSGNTSRITTTNNQYANRGIFSQRSNVISQQSRGQSLNSYHSSSKFQQQQPQQYYSTQQSTYFNQQIPTQPTQKLNTQMSQKFLETQDNSGKFVKSFRNFEQQHQFNSTLNNTMNKSSSVNRSSVQNQGSQDFISQNIQRLRNMIKPTQRY